MIRKPQTLTLVSGSCAHFKARGFGTCRFGAILLLAGAESESGALKAQTSSSET